MEKKKRTLLFSILGLVIVLVVAVIVLFSGGKIGKVIPFLAPSANLAQIVSECQTACSTNSVFEYCIFEKKASFGKLNASMQITPDILTDAKGVSLTNCKALENADVGLFPCADVVCPKCTNQAGEVSGTKAKICLAELCPKEKIKFGSYKDVKEGWICCKADCNA